MESAKRVGNRKRGGFVLNWDTQAEETLDELSGNKDEEKNDNQI